MTSKEKETRRWQFSIRDLLAFTTMVALILAWHRLFSELMPYMSWPEVLSEDLTAGEILRMKYIPGFFLVPSSVALLLWACFLSKYRSNSTGAISLIVIAWLLAALSFVYSNVFITFPYPVHSIQIQMFLNSILFSSVSLPLFATIPAIYCLWGRLRWPAYQKVCIALFYLQL